MNEQRRRCKRLQPRLTPAQLAELDVALRQGPRAQGFRTSLWTLSRVARLITRLTGVQYHPGHVWRLLGTLKWTVQRPAKRAKERNQGAIRQWIRTRWPTVKKTLGGAAPGSSSKTRAVSRSVPRSVARGPHGAKRPC